MKELKLSAIFVRKFHDDIQRSFKILSENFPSSFSYDPERTKKFQPEFHCKSFGHGFYKFGNSLSQDDIDSILAILGYDFEARRISNKCYEAFLWQNNFGNGTYKNSCLIGEYNSKLECAYACLINVSLLFSN